MSNANECWLEDWVRWRTQHENHDEAGDGCWCQQAGVAGWHVKQSPQVPAQLFARGREFNFGRLGSIIVKVGAHKAALDQNIAKSLKFVFGIWVHGPTVFPVRIGFQLSTFHAQPEQAVAA